MTSATIREVAMAAGVSVSTVSRILNGKPDVAEETRQRVLSVIEQLGFVPHAQAQRLAAGRSRTIALLFPLQFVETSHHAGEFIVAAAAAAEEAGFFFHLVTSELTVDSLPTLYQSGQADGVILMQIEMNDPRVQFLRNSSYTFTMIGRTADNSGLSFVDLDFEAAIVEAYAHLVGLGHSAIGFLGAPAFLRQRGLGSAVRTYQGYQAACERFGLDSPAFEVELLPQAMYEATQRLLRMHPRVTAIVSTHGPSIVGAMRALQSLGRSVPRDISVLSIATTSTAEMLTPPLTSIDFPSAEMARTAVNLLLRQLKDRSSEAQQVLFAPRLIERGTTAPPFDG
jgi:DNA-binding LacI/PurR family transcriptional regulator